MAKAAWVYVKKRALAAISAVLIYLGIVQIVSVTKYPIGYAIMRVMNLVIEKAFRDRMLLATPPYSTLALRPYMAKEIAIWVIVIVIGTFVSLLADLKGRQSR
jgi:hypothetical protein